ncbi:MAG: putative kinase [Acidobacteriales bacterium]|nr:putative kinase [Terriglobales bacterium]
MKRRKKSSENTSESTGKIGQAIDPTMPAPLRPSYDSSEPADEQDDDEVESDSAAEGSGADLEEAPAGRGKFEVETQPESPNEPPAAADAATRKAQPSKREPKGVVVLAIGLPGSGKTTWFKRRGVTPLSSDMLRSILFDSITEQRYQGLVFSTLRSLLRARLIAKMPWNYVDATNLSPHERRQWIKMARGFGYEVQAVFFDVPLELCLERNSKRERQVQEDVMRQMASKLKPPTFKEGFSKIVLVRVKKSEGEE